MLKWRRFRGLDRRSNQTQRPLKLKPNPEQGLIQSKVLTLFKVRVVRKLQKTSVRPAGVDLSGVRKEAISKTSKQQQMKQQVLM